MCQTDARRVVPCRDFERALDAYDQVRGDLADAVRRVRAAERDHAAAARRLARVEDEMAQVRECFAATRDAAEELGRAMQAEARAEEAWQRSRQQGADRARVAALRAALDQARAERKGWLSELAQETRWYRASARRIGIEVYVYGESVSPPDSDALREAERDERSTRELARAMAARADRLAADRDQRAAWMHAHRGRR